ncbi:MAG: HD domain-containing protein [Defluviitaleaceae bacterium]|nr:HD domain-containing protein [Defluviitaleaceae bacterium]
MPKIRDPIHDFVEVTDLELKIIDSAPFQRLRNIKQLATSYLVYPGAEHTRFGHSIGVMHLASKAFVSAMNNYANRTGERLFNNLDEAWYKQVLRLIALTHDLGHGPFSHAFEGLFAKDPNDPKDKKRVEHEHFTMRIICETEIAGYIKQISEKFISDNHIVDDIEKYEITPSLLWLIYGQKSPENDYRYRQREFKLLRGFMDSELDCDKMDYLLRDSYFCGVNYGKYDVEKFISSLTVYNNEKDNIFQLAIDRDGIHAFEEFVIARYFMFIQVYFHKTRCYLDYLMIKAVKSLNIGEINSEFPLDQYLKYDDNVIIGLLKEAVQKNNEDAINFMERNVKSCVYQTRIHSNSTEENVVYNQIKLTLSERLKKGSVWEGQAEKHPHKMPVIGKFDDPEGKGVPVVVPHSKTAKSIIEESVLLKGLNSPINIRRIYVDKLDRDKSLEIVRNFYNDTIVEDEGDNL